ncbi:M50 family metallopeptidase [Frondihabitans australicus]|uniref:Membrane-associated protease RseP (Regulator of RpoE activity) n=1 Tax=Frondihabitans australicus TaxID=386892 RepID=A0A495ID31_9MICO|nr:site-2 protease family protein [Frondihabitans australicus]RKR73829.1 membrane-associated protease RseP (regulator of RpoE activity) [Frondihabitans australicus]
METALLFVIGIVVIVVGLVLSIGLHEIGHLIPAKRFGVKVGQYMIGFGPTLWSTQRGETEYGVKAIPLGGYISMSGMFPPQKTVEVAEDALVGAAAGPGARTATTSIFGTLTQDARDASAETVAPGEDDRTFYRLAVPKRIVIMLGGPVMNLLIAIVLYAVVLCGFGTQQVSTTVGSVSECVLPASSTATSCPAGATPSPGAAAGIRPKDTIVSIDGTQITSWTQSTAIIQKSAGTTLDVVVRRDGALKTLHVTPLRSERYKTDSSGNYVLNAAGKKETEEVGFVGIGAAYERQQEPLTAVLPAVWSNVTEVGSLIVHLPQKVVQTAESTFTGQKRDPNGPVSVFGVGRLAGEVATLHSVPILDRLSTLVGLLASLNVALFVFNLIPLLPLDGGHIAGAIIEGVRRFFAKVFKRRDPGPIDIAKAAPLTMAVVAVLGVMSAILIYADIVNPISLG